MIMLYIQITQVMLRRPKRGGHTFWFIIIYASILFPLTTIAFSAKFKFVEALYVALPDYIGGPDQYWEDHSGDLSNIMSQSWYVFHFGSAEDTDLI
jgi:hypothetical protein